MSEPMRRFLDSLKISAEKWRDGTSYDLEAFGALSSPEREEIARSLAGRGRLDWRDVEVLRLTDSQAARDRIALAAETQHDDGGAAALAALVSSSWDEALEARLVAQLEAARLMETSLDKLFEIAERHPTPRVRAVLQKLATDGEAGVRYAFGAFLLYLHGHADEWYGLDAGHRAELLKLGGTVLEQAEGRSWLESRLSTPLRRPPAAP